MKFFLILFLSTFLAQNNGFIINQIQIDGNEIISDENIIQILKNDSLRCYKSYEEMLSQDNKKGLARELARMNLPTNIYTQWYWKTDLHNLFNFIRLRNDKHAQYEIRVYAEVMMEILKKWVPLTYEAFVSNRLNSLTMSSHGIEYIKSLIKKRKSIPKNISKRELETINKIFNC